MPRVSIPVLSASSAYSFALRRRCPRMLSISGDGMTGGVRCIAHFLLGRVVGNHNPGVGPLGGGVICRAPYRLRHDNNGVCAVRLLHTVPKLRIRMLSDRYYNLTKACNFGARGCSASVTVNGGVFSRVGTSGTSCTVASYRAYG